MKRVKSEEVGGREPMEKRAGTRGVAIEREAQDLERNPDMAYWYVIRVELFCRWRVIMGV